MPYTCTELPTGDGGKAAFKGQVSVCAASTGVLCCGPGVLMAAAALLQSISNTQTVCWQARKGQSTHPTQKRYCAARHRDEWARPFSLPSLHRLQPVRY